ncbi:exonuclease subunit SbcD [Microbacterium sp. SYP-A9085]|uniref:exonuclease SbcCD subunit D n=1 Tax=Microbacterium sp. SYP-A9085 TaxID=2664454 RepID=UPI00129A8B40|nr:exonuclease SbcCD subunit D C-terminal domain-containing protein [Microbacterium sp. SYP-A9085]MRH27888.1 exonuclease subunit SbcD [Microbacterium sp. SYP-A9085]
MRILHTSDWHIGRTFHGTPTLSALRGVLEALVATVRSESVDVVVVAGDVFDSAAPAADCYTVLTETLAGLRDTGAHVVVTSGNHDSAARLGFQAALLRDGVRILTDPAAVATPVTIDDEHGPVHFYGIPYLEPALVRRQWPGVRTQAQALAHAMGLVRADATARGGRYVVAAHCFAAGVEATPHLERDIQQGGLDVVPLAVFDGPDYCALGHIHGRTVLSDRVRYAGAPLHYSFGERDKPRGAWIVDLDAAGVADARWATLPVPRPLRVLTGTLDELLADERFADAEDAWVSARYTDTVAQVDPMRRLQRRFPYCAEVRHVPARTAPADTRSFASRVQAARSDTELVDAFLTHVRNGEGADPAEAALIRDVLDERVAVEVSA